MKREILEHRGLAVTAALAALLVVVGLPAAAGAEPGETARARVAVYANGVDFVPEVAHQKAVLTVSGNGKVFRQEFADGRRASIGLFDPDGQLLPDGTYRWQMELVPDTATATKLRAAAVSGEPFEPWRAQSGSFTISGGSIVDDSLSEARAARPGTRDVVIEGTGAARSPADDDAAVGYSAGFEAAANTAARRQAPAAARGALTGPVRAGNDSDAMTMSQGASLERSAASDNEVSAQSRGIAPRPRSDGSNGRPRS